MVRKFIKYNLGFSFLLKFSLLIFLLIATKTKAQNFIDIKDLIGITKTNKIDSLKTLLIEDDNLKYSQQLLIALRLFELENTDVNSETLKKLIPNTKKKAATYWEIDIFTWMEKSINGFWKENNVEVEDLDYIRLESFFNLSLLNPSYINEMFSFTIYSKRFRQVEEFSDFYILYIKKYEQKFFNSIKLLSDNDSKFIIRLIDESADQDDLNKLKKEIKSVNLNIYNLIKEDN